ncbi:flagellar biosynthesis repressor FlbT [Sneathiella marina]|uniref:Flagellar biosynthesis repressor FlbT n=1 Tax=Sneathiella marina TaxID=2950108 RepID=A0ABY4W9X1_9PROT|nr:flagellar biosynthesis repressor FlbT [Sneathiella marina]USG62074.1 flagellar biosynthesis repressor FlbT [Sneathiella marina]
MSLKFRIPAGEKIIVNGAVLTNTGNKAMHFSLENDAAVMRERDILLPNDVETPLQNVYMFVQLMYIEPDNHASHYKSFQDAAQVAFLSTTDVADRGLIFEIVGLVGEKNYYSALKLLRKRMNTDQTET